MQTDFYRTNEAMKPELIGTVTLAQGIAQIPNTLAPLREMTVADARRQYHPSDGVAYLQALPRFFRSPYFWAETH